MVVKIVNWDIFIASGDQIIVLILMVSGLTNFKAI